MPIASLMRSKYHEYPEYHTSLDNMELVTPEGLYGGFEVVKKTIEVIENNNIYKATQLCEAQLGKKGLYPNIGTHDSYKIVQNRLNLLAYSDGETELIDIANILSIPIWELYSEVNLLSKFGLLERC